MKEPKLYKCRICGKEVFKEYWEGVIMVRELTYRNSDFCGSKPHFCQLNYKIKSL